jgi:hypothetical protein
MGWEGAGVRTGWIDDGASPEVALVIRSVLPVFTHESERPDRTGTCVLARVDGRALIVTAAHVLEDAMRTTKRFTIAVGGHLLTIHRVFYATRANDPADIGLVPLDRQAADAIERNGGVFLDANRIDEAELVEGHHTLNAITNKYVAVGFPSSRSRSRIHHATKTIHLKTFSINLTLVPATDYPTGFSLGQHLLLEFPLDEILLEGRPVNPPKVQGMSGGGVFRLRRRQPETTTLVGILIEHHRDVSALVATRWSQVAALARELIYGNPQSFD